MTTDSTPLPELAAKFKTEPKDSKGKRKWKPTGRHILGHLFFNVLGEKCKIPKGKDMPSVDADTMSKFKGAQAKAIGQRISDYRSLERTMTSTRGAGQFIGPASEWDPKTPTPNKSLAEFVFRTEGADAVERVFAKAQGSIPLNLDKGARNAFITDDPDSISIVSLASVSPVSLFFLSKNDWFALFDKCPPLLHFFDPQVTLQSTVEKSKEYFLEFWKDPKDMLRFIQNIADPKAFVSDILSTTGLNLDNMMTLEEIHLLDKATLPRNIWVSFDWSQAELYALCLYSQDEALKTALESGDFHSYIACLAFDLTQAQLSRAPEYREWAKTLTFAFVYSSFDLGVARAIMQNKVPDLDVEILDKALAAYVIAFDTLIQWVKRHQQKWGETQFVEYAFFNPKYIERPEYIKDHNLGSHESGRVAVNTMGQNSVGSMLKKVIAQMHRHESGVFKKYISEAIPIFDALYFKADLCQLSKVLEALTPLISPVIELHPDNQYHPNALRTHEMEAIKQPFSLQMRHELKTSLVSWGEVSKVAQNYDTLYKTEQGELVFHQF